MPADAEERFGCATCCPAEPESAWEARDRLKRAAELIDDSHFHVMILKCPACWQEFVSVFAEMIDYVDGEDPQYWSLLPITKAESASLRARVSEAMLNSLGPDRRCLQRDHPKDAGSDLVLEPGALGGCARLSGRRTAYLRA